MAHRYAKIGGRLRRYPHDECDKRSLPYEALEVNGVLSRGITSAFAPAAACVLELIVSALLGV